MKSPLPLLTLSLLCLLTSVAFAQIPADSIPPLVDSLIQVSRAYTGEAEFDEAFSTNELAGEAAQDCCGKNSAAYAAYCFNEGRIHYFMGQNKEALPWYIQSRELRGKILGTDDIEYSKSCNNLAITYDVMGRYEEAEPLYLEALAVREATSGRQSVTTAKVLGNLGNLYRQMGEYERSEQFITEATNIRKAVSGENSIDYAISLMLLGGQKDDNRNYEDALALFLQAKEIIENQERIQYYYYLQALEYLAGIYSSLEDYATAKKYLTEVAEIIEGGYGKVHYRYARCLNSLAALAFQDGNMDESKALLEQQVGLLEQLGYQQSRAYGIALQDLSRISSRQGAPQQALQYLDRALVILEQNISPYSQAYRFALWEYAAIQQSLEQYAVAASTLGRIATLEEKTLVTATRSLPERDLAYFTQEYFGYLSRSMELAKDYPPIADLCYNKLLFYKGFLLDRALTLRRYAQQGEETKSLYKRLRGINRELTQLYTDTEADAQRVTELETQAEQLQRELARTQPKNDQGSQALTWQDIQQRLGPTEAALEFAASIEYSTTGEALDYNYAGLLILPGADVPIYFPLCSQTDLDSVFTLGTGNVDAINGLYEWAGKGQQLYQLIWQPITDYLSDYSSIKKIYFSSDGTFHRINLGALPASERRVIGQDFELVQLTTTRNLLAEQDPLVAGDRSAVLFGGITYGSLDAPDAIAAPRAENEETGTSTRRRSDTSNFRAYDPNNGYWQELPWTEVEINYAKEVLEEAGYTVNLYTGNAATEERFKTVEDKNVSPAVIHLATHGYFFAEPKDKPDQRPLPFAQAKMNLIRSGLILADGNYAWVNGSGRSQGLEDGVLTALELSQLELDETKLVILSACETGLGDIRRNEGVYGLQRALKKAGVRYSIISLWQVPDYQAQAFMSSFYLAWLEEGKAIPEAFRNAQAYMRARYKEAFEWAGFILVQ